WKSEPPAGFPLETSREIGGITLTSRHAEYTHSDTWCLSWAADGNLYSPYMDGRVKNTAGRELTHATSGVAVVKGDDPLRLEVLAVDVSPNPRNKPFVSMDGRNVSGDFPSQGFVPIMVNGGPYIYAYACAGFAPRGVWYLAAH